MGVQIVTNPNPRPSFSLTRMPWPDENLRCSGSCLGTIPSSCASNGCGRTSSPRRRFFSRVPVQRGVQEQAGAAIMAAAARAAGSGPSTSREWCPPLASPARPELVPRDFVDWVLGGASEFSHETLAHLRSMRQKVHRGRRSSHCRAWRDARRGGVACLALKFAQCLNRT